MQGNLNHQVIKSSFVFSNYNNHHFTDEESSGEDSSNEVLIEQQVSKRKLREISVLSSSNDVSTPTEGSSFLPVNLVDEITETVLKKIADSKSARILDDNIPDDFKDSGKLPFILPEPANCDFESMDPRFYMVKFSKFLEYLDKFDLNKALDKVCRVLQSINYIVILKL